MAFFDPITKKFLCQCGCGEEISFERDFRPGHNVRLKNPVDSYAVRKKISDSCKVAYVNTPGLYEKTVAQLKEATDKRWSTPGAREHASLVTSRTAKEVWDSYTIEEKLERLRTTIHSPESLNASHKTSRRGFSETEKLLYTYLEEDFPGVFSWNKDKEKNIGDRFPDIYSDSLKLVIECFGSAWHSGLYEEEEKVEHYKKLGWNCIIVWADSIWDIIYEYHNVKEDVQICMSAVKVGTK